MSTAKDELPGLEATAAPVRFKAQERGWVKRLLARLTPDERRQYEAQCTLAARHPRSGKLYDDAKAEIAERIMALRASSSGDKQVGDRNNDVSRGRGA